MKGELNGELLDDLRAQLADAKNEIVILKAWLKEAHEVNTQNKKEIADLQKWRTVGQEEYNVLYRDLASAQATIARLRIALSYTLATGLLEKDAEIVTSALALPTDDQALFEFGFRVGNAVNHKHAETGGVFVTEIIEAIVRECMQ